MAHSLPVIQPNDAALGRKPAWLKVRAPGGANYIRLKRLLRDAKARGVPVAELIPKDRLETIIQQTRDGGADIVKLLKTGSAYYAPSAAVAEMVEAIVGDKKKIVPCAALCQGEYGFHDLFLGVPAKLGGGGMEGILELKLTPAEQSGLKKSADAVAELCRAVDKMI